MPFIRFPPHCNVNVINRQGNWFKLKSFNFQIVQRLKLKKYNLRFRILTSSMRRQSSHSNFDIFLSPFAQTGTKELAHGLGWICCLTRRFKLSVSFLYKNPFLSLSKWSNFQVKTTLSSLGSKSLVLKNELNIFRRTLHDFSNLGRVRLTSWHG